MGSRYRAEPAKKTARMPEKKMPIHAKRKSVSRSRRFGQAMAKAPGNRAGNTRKQKCISSASLALGFQRSKRVR